MNKEFIITCPHCGQLIIIVEFNCRILCCGVLKSNAEQINPHSNKNIWDDWTANNLIYGCWKPFFMDANNKALLCDYL